MPSTLVNKSEIKEQMLEAYRKIKSEMTVLFTLRKRDVPSLLIIRPSRNKLCNIGIHINQLTSSNAVFV